MIVPDETLNLKIRELAERVAKAIMKDEKIWEKAGVSADEAEIVVHGGRIYIILPRHANAEAFKQALSDIDWLRPLLHLVKVEVGS